MNLGLIDYGFRAQITPRPWLDVQVDYHFFQTAKGGPQGETALGNEIDFRARLTLGEQASVVLLYGVFAPDEAMAAVRGLPPNGVKTEHRALLTTDFRF